MTNVNLKKLLLTIIVFLTMIAVPVHAAVDARVVSLTSEPSPMYVNDAATLTVRVDNIGADAAVNAVVRYEITRDSNVISSGSDTISLGASEVQDLTYAWSPTVSDTYDVNANITIESDVNNASNTGTIQFDVDDNVSFTDFDATDIIYADEFFHSAQPITFTGTVLKNGAGLPTTVTFSIAGVGVLGSVPAAANGAFTFTYSNGIQFAGSGETTVSASVYEGGETIQVQDTVTVESSGISGDGLVNMVVSPYKLKLAPGQLFDYIVSIASVGDRQGTFVLDISTHDEFEYWLSPEIQYIHLRAGEQEDISLFVNVPSDAAAGNYPITIKLEDLNGRLEELEKVYLEIEDIGQGNGHDDGFDDVDSGLDYDVNINIEPRTLNVRSGSYREFDVLVQNIGTHRDTFDLTFRAPWNIDHWFDWEHHSVSLDAGKYTYVSLYVDVPIDARVDTYAIRVTAEGHSSDTEKSDLVIGAPANNYDLSLSRPKVTPSGFDEGAVSTVTVTAPVGLVDLKSGGGRYVTIKLYADDSYMESKTVYIASGQTKDLQFTMDPEDGPFYDEAGVYEIYYTASIDGEYEKSSKVDLEIGSLEKASISSTPNTFEINPNGTFEMTIRVKNPSYESQTYLMYTKGIEVDLTPESITVLPEETKTVTVTGKLNNAPAGLHNVDLYIGNGNTEEYTTITLEISEEYSATTVDGSVDGAGLTGYLLTTTGGIAAMIVSLVLLAALVGYYYYSKQDEGVLEGDGDDTGINYGGNGGSDTQPPGASSGLLSKIKNTFIEANNTNPVNGSEEMKSTENRLNLARLETANVAVVHPTEKVEEPRWHAKDAEHVLSNLESIKNDFHKTYNEANATKEKLHGFAKSIEQKSQSVQKHLGEADTNPNVALARPEPVTKTEVKNGYIKSVIESV